MERQPMSRPRSPWELDKATLVIHGVPEQVWRRRTGDGTITAISAREPMGWHLSVSFMDHRGRYSRYPSWDEIADAREQFIPEEVTMAMILPPPGEYVAAHMTTFHLHEIFPDESPGRRDGV